MKRQWLWSCANWQVSFQAWPGSCCFLLTPTPSPAPHDIPKQVVLPLRHAQIRT